jgi:thioesterase domain-containing protein/acyl carrier protein
MNVSSVPIGCFDAEHRRLTSKLISWARELLGVSDLDLDDDFFGRGADSLHVVRLLTKIKRTYGVELELAAISDAPSMRQLANEILVAKENGGVQHKSWTSLVPIQPIGSRVPLFFVHAIGGDIDLYVQMANVLGCDQPVYAFRSPLLFQKQLHEIGLTDLASIYVKELRAFFPEGPYQLAGASFGGHLAFEMARQLHAQGTTPDLLLIIDAVVPGSDENLEVRERVSTIKKRLKNEGFSYLLRRIAVKASYSLQELGHRGRLAACKLCHHLNRRPPHSLRFFEIEILHRRALMRHRFDVYSGLITLMKAVDPASEILSKRRDVTLGWGKLAAEGARVYEVPAAHISMLYPPALISFAQLLNTILSRAKAADSTAFAE